MNVDTDIGPRTRMSALRCSASGVLSSRSTRALSSTLPASSRPSSAARRRRACRPSSPDLSTRTILAPSPAGCPYRPLVDAAELRQARSAERQGAASTPQQQPRAAVAHAALAMDRLPNRRRRRRRWW